MHRLPFAVLPVVLAALFLATLPGFARLPDTGSVPVPVATGCNIHFAAGMPPALVNQRLASRTRGLCNRAFATLHSGLTRTPLYSAEHLTAAALEAARDVRRVNLFHPDERLPSDERAELSDYARSGYDRGHMAPSGDMPDAEAQAQSFSLANMVPQAPQLNRGTWEGIESVVRDLARLRGELYVVTGPVYSGSDVQSLGGRVLVPTSIWKAVMDPASGRGAAYLSPNTDDGTWEVVSLARLRDLTGLDVFPAMDEAAKVQAVQLPEPRPYRDRGRRGRG